MNTHGKSRSVFEQSLPIVAAALGRLCGVKIQFGYSTPATDGETIYMPLMPSIDEDTERQTLGTLCHECGHVRFTDMKAGGRKPTTFEHAIDNALEDVRIEREMGRLYLGAESLFRATHEPQVKSLSTKDLTDDRSLIVLFVLTHAHVKVSGREWMGEFLTKLTVLMHDRFGQELTDALGALALEVKDAKSTEDVMAIRKKMMALFKRYAIQPPKASGTSTDKAQAESGNDATADNQSQTQSGEMTSGTGTPSGEPMFDERVSQLLRRDPVEVFNPLDISGSFKRIKSKPESRMLTFDVTGQRRPAKGDADRGKRRLQLARSDSTVLRLALHGLVQAKAHVGRQIAKSGRRLSFTHLSRLALGDARVFEKRAEKKAPNTAVHVLLDLSGSMGLKGGDLATRASLGLVMALEGIRGVNPGFTVYPGTACGVSDLSSCCVLPHGHKTFELKPDELGGIESWGGTPTVQALTAAGLSLAACKEERKFVILMTDGRVCETACRQLIEELEASGIRTFGIQIGEDRNLSAVIPDAALVNDIGELKEVLFGFAKTILL